MDFPARSFHLARSGVAPPLSVSVRQDSRITPRSLCPGHHECLIVTSHQAAILELFDGGGRGGTSMDWTERLASRAVAAAAG